MDRRKINRHITTRDPEVIRYIDQHHRRKYGYPKGDQKPLWKRIKAQAWHGQRAFIIGGGPSLIGFDFSRLENQGKIVVVNRAYLDLPFADLMVALDPNLYMWIHDGTLGKEALKRFQEFQGLKVWLGGESHNMKGVYFVYRIRYAELAKNLAHGVHSGNNSGVGALMLTATLGCSPIYLLGFDARHQGRKAHYHSGYPNIQHRSTAKSFARYFAPTAKILKKHGVRVFNCNNKSNIRCFPFCDIEKVLK